MQDFLNLEKIKTNDYFSELLIISKKDTFDTFNYSTSKILKIINYCFQNIEGNEEKFILNFFRIKSENYVPHKDLGNRLIKNFKTSFLLIKEKNLIEKCLINTLNKSLDSVKYFIDLNKPHKNILTLLENINLILITYNIDVKIKIDKKEFKKLKI